MKTRHYFTFALVILGSISFLTAQTPQLEVEGNAKVRGILDISHPGDTTTVLIGENAGIDLDYQNNRRNTFVGSRAGRKNTAGGHNSFYGYSSGYFNTTGKENAFFGAYAGSTNAKGEANSFFGSLSGARNISGFGNSYFGNFSGWRNTRGSKNTILGAFADQSNLGDTINTAIAIGYQAFVGCDNCAVLGGTGENAVNLGINIEIPQTRLHAVGDQLRLSAENDVQRYIQFRTDGTALDLDAHGGPLYINAGPFIAMGLSGKVGIGTDMPTDKLDVVGGVRMRSLPTGIFNADLSLTSNGTLIKVGSDRRLKNNIRNLDNALTLTQRLHGVRYVWKDDPDKLPRIGLIAQEVEEVLPEVVFTNEVDGYKGVRYQEIVALLIEAVKEQQVIIDKQQAEIKEQQTEIINLKKQSEKIESLQSEVQQIRKLLEAQL